MLYNVANDFVSSFRLQYYVEEILTKFPLYSQTVPQFWRGSPMITQWQ